MRISLRWLREHIEVGVGADELSRRLLMMGFEVASIEREGPAFAGVVAAQILEISRHPNADRLSLCVVDDGREKLSIVCGAKNIAIGQKVPLARVGAKLPGGKKITRSKIRGVESNGMICSSEELGLDASRISSATSVPGPQDPGLGAGVNGGILVLDPGAEVGADLASRLGEADEVLDVEITPNRPDCLSHLGLARELAAHLRLPLKPRPAPQLPAARGECRPIRIDAPEACLTYIGRELSGLCVGPSPAWLAAKLEAVGLRPINNVVDVTNFILMDAGQPMHAFDLDKLRGGEMRVRWARPGEKLKTLDGRTYDLAPAIPVIADSERPAALAGVMGGEETAVTEATKRVFLESAHFSAPVVRKASQALRLRSDASYRFERGVDPAGVQTASLRAAELIARLCGPQATMTAAAAVGRAPQAPAPIVVTAARVNEILGCDFSETEVEGALRAISAGLERQDRGLVFRPPSYRGDLESAWDLAEETARLLSYDQVPARLPVTPAEPAKTTRLQALYERLRRRLAGFGLLEAYNYDLTSDKALADARLADDGRFVRLANPLSEDWTTLRPSLLPGLLQSAALNARRGAASARLFELGRGYARAGAAVSERNFLAAALYGPGTDAFWQAARTPASEVFEALGIAEDLLSDLPGVGRRGFSDIAGGPGDAAFNPAASARWASESGWLATAGQLHPKAARRFGLERHGVVLLELDLDALGRLQAPPTVHSPVSQFPSSWRDLSILVDRSQGYAKIEAAARAAAGETLASLSLIDVFEGKGVPEGRRSLTLRLTFGRADRTLTDEEVASAMDKVLATLKAGFGAALRS